MTTTAERDLAVLEGRQQEQQQVQERDQTISALDHLRRNNPGGDLLGVIAPGRIDERLNQRNALFGTEDEERRAAANLAAQERFRREGTGDPAQLRAAQEAAEGVDPEILDLYRNVNRNLESEGIRFLYSPSGDAALQHAVDPRSDGGVDITQEEFENIRSGRQSQNIDLATSIPTVGTGPRLAANVAETLGTQSGRTAVRETLRTTQGRLAFGREVGSEAVEEAVPQAARITTDRDAFSPGDVIVGGGIEGTAEFIAGRRVRGSTSGNIFEEASDVQDAATSNVIRSTAGRAFDRPAPPTPVLTEQGIRSSDVFTEARAQSPAPIDSAVADGTVASSTTQGVVSPASGSQQAQTQQSAAVSNTVGGRSATRPFGSAFVDTPDVDLPILPLGSGRRGRGGGALGLEGADNLAIQRSESIKVIDLSVPPGQDNTVSTLVNIHPLQTGRRGNAPPIPGVRESQHVTLITDGAGRTQRRVSRRTRTRQGEGNVRFQTRARSGRRRRNRRGMAEIRGMR